MKLLAIIGAPSTQEINAAFIGNFKNVTRWSTPVVAYSSAPAVQVIVQHDLNAVPNMIAVEPRIDCRWWVDQDDRAGWSSSAIMFHASAKGQFTVRAGFQ